MSSENETPAIESAPNGDESNTSGSAPTAPAEGAHDAGAAGSAAGSVEAAPDAPSGDTAPEGSEGDDAGEGEGDGGDTGEGDEGEPADAASADATPGEPGKKKKRRKRKKKKPGAEGAEGGEGAPGGDRPRQHHRPATERAPFHVGEEVFGKVTAVLDTAVMVDLSGKALAIFDRTEMEADDLVPSVGDRFVARIHNDGVRGGLVVLTRKPLREEEIKPAIEAASKDGSLITGLITGVIKGGVEVDISGLRAFAPASGLDLHPQNANFSGLVGQRLEFKVVQYKNAGRDVVVSRRPMLEAEAHERRKHALTLLTEGQVLKGVVRTVVEWGAFVALPEAENLEGLVHVSEAKIGRASCRERV